MSDVSQEHSDVADGVAAALACPRCGVRDDSSRFYGPCEACRDELGRTMRLVPRDVTVEAYTPKVNVVANHVATKD